jgi:serine/threonine protein kinase
MSSLFPLTRSHSVLSQGIAFCHSRLVAHQVRLPHYFICELNLIFVKDIDRDNILVNFAGGMCQPEETNWSTRDWAPFRSYFPIRYFINDFELAVTFDPDSDPSSRVVTGLPTAGVRPGQYGRDVAPEMLLTSPYCPFRADIWQLGKMFQSIFGVCPLLLL